MVINRGTQISLDLEVAGAEYAPVYKITENIQFDLDQVDRKQWAFEHLIIDPKSFSYTHLTLPTILRV